MLANLPLECAYPWIWILAPLPLLVSQRLRVLKTHAPLRWPVPKPNIGPSKQTRSLASLLWWTCWFLLLLAASRPQAVGAPIVLQHSGRDILLAVDISPSMQQVDIEQDGRLISRIDALKQVISTFIDQRHGDRLGLLVFASQPFLQVPLTFDTKTVQQLLDETAVGMAGQSTALGDAIALGTRTLLSKPHESRLLILITDGANNDGTFNPIQAAKLSAQAHVVIDTIGIANTQRLLPAFGSMIAAGPNQEIDESTLQTVANITGGQYYRATDGESLKEIYNKINQLNPYHDDGGLYRPRHELFHVPLSILLALWVLTWFPSIFTRLIAR